jgi:transcription initiation factor TFIID subunit 6
VPPVLCSVVIPDQRTDQPPLVDKKKLKPKNENEPAKILPQSPPPRSILAPAGAGAASGAGRKGRTPKHVLSRELQVYYSRLTTALLPPTNEQAKRAAALSSLQYDAGLQNLLPYLVRWVGERVITAIRNSNTDPDCGTSLEILLRVIHALIQNERLFMEPYVRFLVLVFHALLTTT